MPRSGCLVEQLSDGWRIVALDGSGDIVQQVPENGDLTDDSLAQAVGDFVQQHRLSPRRIILAIASRKVLTGRCAEPDADRVNRRMRCYQLESVLPKSAEEFVADFLLHDGEFLGVALEIQAWLPLVAALESRGLQIQSIAPVALLALQSLADEVALDSWNAVVWVEETSWEYFQLREGRLVDWLHWRPDPNVARRHLAVQLLGHHGPLRLALVNGSDASAHAVDGLDGLRWERVDTRPAAEHALRMASAIAEGRRSAWTELRRDELAAEDPNRAIRGSLKFFGLSCCVLLAALSAACWIRSARVEREIQSLQEAKTSLYRQMFPDSRVPGGILSRMRSEHAKLQGSHESSGKVQLPRPALVVFQAFLAGLPQNVRYRLGEIRIEDGQLDVDAEVRSHADAGKLVESLRQAGFEMDPPATVQQSSQMVVTRLYGNLPAMTASSGERER